MKKLTNKQKLLVIIILIISGVSGTLLGMYKGMPKKDNIIKRQNNGKYTELENVKLDYDLAQMIEDKCYIVMDSGAVYHTDELDNFIRNVENNISDEIRIVEYKEEQPILTNLRYENNKFILKIDNRRNGYASTKDKKIITNEYDATKYKLIKENTPNNITDLRKHYSLNLKSIKTNKIIPVCNYVEIKKELNEKFRIEFNKNDENEQITKILDKKENNNYDYDIYSYKGTVDIIIDGEKMPLRDALINNKISVEEILEKAYKDAKENKTIYANMYLDGGSSFYIYNDYQILKCNTLSGNRELYIGVPSMKKADVIKTQE